MDQYHLVLLLQSLATYLGELRLQSFLLGCLLANLKVFRLVHRDLFRLVDGLAPFLFDLTARFVVYSFQICLDGLKFSFFLLLIIF